jgi:hypothetical protein
VTSIVLNKLHINAMGGSAGQASIARQHTLER